MRRFSTDSRLAHALPFLAAACSPLPGRALGAVRAVGGGGRAGHGDVLLEHGSHPLGVARLEGCEQVTVLVHHPTEVLPAPVAVEVRPDPGPDRPPDLHRVRLAGGADDDLVEAEVGLDDARQVVRAGRLLHQPDLLAELGEVLVGHPLERPQEAVPLEGEANRDQHLLHLVVGDAEDDRAPIGERHHEALVLELSQRLPDGAAARPELGREGRLDQALAGLVAAHDDRAAQDLDDLLPSRAPLARLSLEDDCRCALDAIGHGRAHHRGLSTITKWLTISGAAPSLAILRCGSRASIRLRCVPRCASLSSGPAGRGCPPRGCSWRSTPTRVSSASAKPRDRRCRPSGRSSRPS